MEHVAQYHTLYFMFTIKIISSKYKVAQWLSGRVFDLRPRVRGFEPHQRHCVVVLEEDLSLFNWNIVDGT